ncbi:MAG TPA: pyridoxamine 5'-phosphate oxidase [Calditrichia bacterium]|nr:pyridoxamine 5'-phosphate oxidase [Calditrichota bacterium]HQU71528.1 pyridoxamine 5'-phosphate oxidase [Calditrichia bacterium]HQV32765.1 pyridoxamine 5'-phosphate oxidase [Calditrichia bacterium]
MSSHKKFEQFRTEYRRGDLLEKDAPESPLALFEIWFAEVSEVASPEPNAMILATADKNGMPSQRAVLLKEVAGGQFIFYSNYESRKGMDLAANPAAALLFYWPELHRQVRIEGMVSRVAGDISDRYFASRPRESQLGAWASQQSSTIENRQTLEDTFREVAEKFEGRDVPRPPYWGGYQLRPVRMEFWQGRPNRLHDRLLYCREAESWLRSRLSP